METHVNVNIRPSNQSFGRVRAGGWRKISARQTLDPKIHHYKVLHCDKQLIKLEFLKTMRIYMRA